MLTHEMGIIIATQAVAAFLTIGDAFDLHRGGGGEYHAADEP